MNIFKKIFRGNTLYYPGCLTKFAGKEIYERYKIILELEGIDHIVLKDKELCCGSPVKNAGSSKYFKELAQKNLKLFRDHSVEYIISNCPSCVLVFKKNYQELLGDNWDIKVSHISEVLDKSLSKIKKIIESKKATYHDPCHLGRELGVYKEPREVIKRAGYELVEMDFSGIKSFCCGAGGGVGSNERELSNRIGGDRVDQALKVGAEFLITSCPMCYLHLKKSAKGRLKVLELSELILN